MVSEKDIWNLSSKINISQNHMKIMVRTLKKTKIIRLSPRGRVKFIKNLKNKMGFQNNDA
jgi:hypothetical protein